MFQECHDSPRRLLTCNSESASQPLGCRSNIPRGQCKGHAFQGRRTPQLRLWEVSTEIPPQEVRPLVVPALVIRTMITGYLQQFAKLGVLPFSEYMEGQNFYCMMGVCAASSGLDDKHIDIKCLKHIKNDSASCCKQDFMCGKIFLRTVLTRNPPRKHKRSFELGTDLS